MKPNDADADGVASVDLVKVNDGFEASVAGAVEAAGLLKLKLGVEPVSAGLLKLKLGVEPASAGLLKLKLGAATDVEGTTGLSPPNEPSSGFLPKLNEGAVVRAGVAMVGSLAEAVAGLEKLKEGVDVAAGVDAEPNAANGLGLLGADADGVAPNDANGFDAGVGAEDTVVPDRLTRGLAILRPLITSLPALTTGSITSRELSSSSSSYLSLVSCMCDALLDIAMFCGVCVYYSVYVL